VCRRLFEESVIGGRIVLLSALAVSRQEGRIQSWNETPSIRHHKTNIVARSEWEIYYWGPLELLRRVTIERMRG